MKFHCLVQASLSFAIACLPCVNRSTHANDWPVAGAESFRDALGRAKPGDQILLATGTYRGTFHIRGLTGVTIRSANADDPAVIDANGAGEGLKLSTATRVNISNLIVENASANGINIDDGGFEKFSTRIVLRNVVVRNGGGHGIKFAGVDGFLIDSITLQDWGNGHAGLNFLGTHNGIVQHSLIQRTNTQGGFGIKVEGGSTNVAIRANRFERAGERAIQFGGSVGLDPFRSRATGGSTAEKLAAEANVIVDRGADAEGIHSAVAFIGARDVEFRHNLVYRPSLFVGRVLKENLHPDLSNARNRVFRNNVVVWYDGDFSNASPFNAGPGTFPQSLQFASNQWLNLTPRAPSEVLLPTKERAGTFGIDSGVRPDAAIAWEFSWGKWVVNATLTEQAYVVDAPGRMRRATPKSRTRFGPALAHPLVGDWNLAELKSAEITLPPMSACILVYEVGVAPATAGQ